MSVAHVGKLCPSRARTSNSLLAISPTFQWANNFEKYGDIDAMM
jgi:hypothetical protein